MKNNSGMQTKQIIPINKVVNDVYKNHVANKQINDVVAKVHTNSSLTIEQVEQIIVLYIYGVSNNNIMKWFDITLSIVQSATTRKCYRKLDLSFQISKQKRLGKMVFTYDKDLVEKYFNSLPDELKYLSNGVMIEDRLVIKTKILKSEIIL